MKVVNVIGHLYKGGAERQLRLLAANSSFENHIFCKDSSGTEKISKYNVTTLLNLNFSTLKGHLLNIEPDLVVLWLPDRITVPFAIICKILKIPFISMDRRAPSNTKHLFFRDRIKYAVHYFSNGVISNYTISSQRNYLQSLIVNNKNNYKYIPNGFEIDLFKENKNKVTLDDGSVKLFFVGRLVKQKKVNELILLVKSLYDKGINVTCCIFGDGPEKDKLINLSQDLNISSLIRFRGNVLKWQEHVNKSWIFVFPSENEGMPNVVFECMALGVLVVTKDIKETSEILIHKKNCLKYKNAFQLLELISKLAQDCDSYKSVRVNSLKTVQYYSVERMVLNMELFFTKVVKG